MKNDNIGLDDLFVEIGLHLTLDNLGSEPQERNKLKTLGKDWFDRNRQALSEKVCSREFMEQVDRLEKDEAQLVAAIADAILVAISVIPPVTVARIIVRIGVHRFCDMKA